MHLIELVGPWSSQDSVDTRSPHFVSLFELFGAQASKMTVPAGSIVERHDVVGHIGQSEVTALVDLLLDPFLLQAAEE